jgi:hypothetical protein
VTDGKDEIDESILADARVRQYWDGEGIVGRYLAETDLGGLGYPGFVYDVFYVFGPDATWDPAPAPVAGVGTPVLYEGDKLIAALQAQLST